MHVIIFSGPHGRTRQIDFSRPALLGAVGLGCVLLFALTFFAGFRFAGGHRLIDPDTELTVLGAELKDQKKQIDEARRTSRENFNALAYRLGQMNAHVIRLDAMGRRLTGMAGLDDGEFDFDNPPALGGPEPEYAEAAGAVTAPDLMSMLGDLEDQLEDRERQLGVLENLLLNRNLSRQVYPKGRPVKAGWISSYFGKRTDPFTGRPAYHKGVDFAGKSGAQVVAVASGVVTRSGKRSGYGTMVEINHGNGYSTRYAHNAENMVDVGEAVKKGQTIATMGATGRATGPNLHFEVLQNGRAVNPLSFIRESN